MEHKVLREHLGPRLPGVLLNAATLDPAQGFCEDCMRWVDLQADAAQAERELGPWETVSDPARSNEGGGSNCAGEGNLED
jgi:hypothetical protein